MFCGPTFLQFTLFTLLYTTVYFLFNTKSPPKMSRKNTLCPLTLFYCILKGPKLEIFGSRVFPQIRPVCVGDLGTRRKNSKFHGLGLKIAVLYFLALSQTSLKIFKRYRRRRKQILSAVGDGGKKS